MPQRGWNSVSVPGCVSAWVTLSERFGKLPFADLFEPAIGYARDGYMVSPTIAKQWANQAAELHVQPGFKEAFMPRGRAPLSYHGDSVRWSRRGAFCHLRTVARGQELVLDCDEYPAVRRWAEGLVRRAA